MPDVDYQRLPKALKHPMRVALDNGWKVVQKTAAGYRIESPGGTQRFYVPFKTKAADLEARVLMRKVTLAVANEDTPESRRVLDELNDPKNTNSTLECDGCKVEFVTVDGYEAHLEACIEATRARLAAEEEASKAITPPQEEEPSEGHTEVPVEQVEDPSKSSGSGKIGNKEEDQSMGENTGGYKRGPYNRREIVKPGIARAIYEAMRVRTQHRDEALSVYANVIGAMVEVEIGALSDAEQKLASIFEVLGLDPDASERADALAAENERISNNLKSLKDLLSDIN